MVKYKIKSINTKDIPGGPEKNVPKFAQVLSRSLSRYEGDIMQVYYVYNLGHV